MMNYFSMPADFKTRTIECYSRLNAEYKNHCIYETYGQVTAESGFGSGRMLESLPQIDFAGLKEYIAFSRQHGIEFNYTLNPSCLGNSEFSKEGFRKVMELLERIIDAGASTVTVALPSLVDIIRIYGLPLNIKISTICQISSPDKALAWKKFGVHQVVVDENITRDFLTLKEICRVFGEGVEIIVNSICFKNCPYRMFHYNHEAHCLSSDFQGITEYYYLKCILQKADDLANMIKLNWIRPEDLHYYRETGISYFKLQGRHVASGGDPVKAVEHYFKEEYTGNLLALLTLFTLAESERFVDNKSLDGFLDRFFTDPGFCRNVCSECGYCLKFAQKSMDMEKTAHIHKYAQYRMGFKLISLFDWLKKRISREKT